MQRVFTPQELEFIRENCERMTAEDLAEALDAKPGSIRGLCWRYFRLHPKYGGQRGGNHSMTTRLLKEKQKHCL